MTAVLNPDNKILSLLKRVLGSFLLTPCLLLLGFCCWAFDGRTALIVVYAVVFVLSLLFLTDVKNILSMVFFVAFFINDIFDTTVWDLYLPIIGCGFGALIGFLIKNLSLKKGKLKRGQLFTSLVVAGFALVFGGIQRFDISVFAVTAGLFVATYILYFIAVNFTTMLKEYLTSTFILGALVLFLQMAYADLEFYLGLDNVSMQTIRYIGTQNVNVLATYLFIGMTFAMYRGVGRKNDVCYVVLAIAMIGGAYLSTCKTVQILSVLFFFPLLVLMIIKSKNKIFLIIIFVLSLGVAVYVLSTKMEEIIKAINEIITPPENDVGRGSVWPWCWNKFLEYPIFGYGFIAGEEVPGTFENYMNIVMAHNTLLQWLTSLGVVGTLLMGYLYFKKYSIAFKNLTIKKMLYVSCLLAIALTGITDQAPTMDFFMFVIPLIIVSSIEKQEEDFQKNPKKIFGNA